MIPSILLIQTFDSTQPACRSLGGNSCLQSPFRDRFFTLSFSKRVMHIDAALRYAR